MDDETQEVDGTVHTDLWDEAVNDWMRVQLEVAVRERAGRETRTRRLLSGDVFALEVPDKLPSIWGVGDKALWVEGEGLMIVGPQGVGKTTLAQQLLLARAGLKDELLGMPVAPAKGKVLYLAMDRPLQARRSLNRMVSKGDAKLLKQRTIFWEGPLPFSIADASKIASWAKENGATDVFVDSYKDLAPNLSDEATGALINMIVQECMAERLEWVGLHHHRKATAENPTPKTLHDVHGSGLLTRGLGSVLGLGGEPGDDVVEARHLKQPAEPLGTFGIRHEHSTGTSEMADAPVRIDARSAGKVENIERIKTVMQDGTDWTLALLVADDGIKASKGVVRDYLKELTEAGVIERTQAGEKEGHWKLVAT